ncbi:M14-type cytosolic carboxypeptidase [Persicitalea sp.]|uniref:M14-type cytosolic carboxypeptidase n=1 Tax=Persicitalea sp. TaxID=3100273 RepID=UPI003593D421
MQRILLGLVLLLPFQLAAQIKIKTDFEGGRLGTLEKVSPTHYRCAVAGESDSQNRNRQSSWYYFKVENAKGKALTIDLTDLVGEYNYKPGSHAITAQTRPVVSYDNATWRHLTDNEVSWNEEKVELTLKLKPERNGLWVAHQPPYTTARLTKLLSNYQSYPNLTTRSIGQTPKGRPIPLLTITNAQIPTEKKKVVWLMARQHAWEAGTSWVMEGVIKHLLESDEGKKMLDKVVFQLIPMADPDGVVRGGVRFNQFGHDLNRNWDLVQPAEMPEIQAQKKAIVDWLTRGNRIDFFLTLHNTENADYVQGPDVVAGQKFWQSMVDNTSFESSEGLRKMPESTTLGQPGRMTVNQALWAEQQVPAYLMELKVERVNKLDGRRLTPDWLLLGPGLVRAAVTAVE